jgi:hypothetical protein
MWVLKESMRGNLLTERNILKRIFGPTKKRDDKC